MHMSGFIGVAYEGISSFLHNRRQKALHKTVQAIDSKATIQQNKLMYLENSVVMYDIYNAEILENHIHTMHHMHNSTTEIEILFAAQLNTAHTWYINAQDTQHYAIDSLLLLCKVVWGQVSLMCVCVEYIVSHIFLYMYIFLFLSCLGVLCVSYNLGPYKSFFLFSFY